MRGREAECKLIMKDMIKSLSLKAEFALVIGISFGYFILGSLVYVLSPRSSAPITQRHMVSLIFYEAAVLSAVLWFLKQRGWAFDDFKLKLSIRTTGYGILLAISAYISYALLWLFASFISPAFVTSVSQSPLVSNDISVANIVVGSIINPLFEELLVVGYAITTLKKLKGTAFAINSSVAIRLVYHLYQGPLGVMNIIPIGLIFAYWYANRESLWPVIVAHAIFDFVGLYAHQ